MGTVADLLAVAQAAGLRLEVHGDRLRVTGPKSAESIVRQIQDRKPEVLVALACTKPVSQDRDRMRRAFRAAGLPVEMPVDQAEARNRLHRLLEYEAPRPRGVPQRKDLVVLLGGRRHGPRLVCSYEPWPDDPEAPPLRWRLTDSTGWRALNLGDEP